MEVPDRPSFDLIDEPWIPVIGADGADHEVGIREALARAHEFATLAGDLPTQTFALTRLLLAVLYRALDGPRTVDDWDELWRADRLPAERIGAYLDRHRDRFDLLHPVTPFMQVADMRTAKGETSSLTMLVGDVPNNAPFFTTRLGEFTLSYAEAARWLVHCHAFDPSGIRTGPVGDPRAKGGRVYPIGVAWSGLLGGVLVEGVTLKETLLLNLVARDEFGHDGDPAADLPVWERPPTPVGEEVPGGRPPTGPADLFTWQSRRVRLFTDGERVTRVLVGNGERLTPQNRHTMEPHTGWRRSEPQEKKLGRSPVYMPRIHNSDRAIWRGLQALLPEATPTRQGQEAADALAPPVIDWLGKLRVEGCIEPDRLVRVHAIGMVYGSNSSLTDDLISDTLALRATLASRDTAELARIAIAAVQAAEGAARALGNLAGNLAAAAGGDGTSPRSRWMERAYADLDQPFRSWLVGLKSDSDPTDAQTAWHQQVRSIVEAAARLLMRDIPPAAWEGREVRGRVLTPAHAELWFRTELRKALPYAFPAPVPAAASQ